MSIGSVVFQIIFCRRKILKWKPYNLLQNGEVSTFSKYVFFSHLQQWSLISKSLLKRMQWLFQINKKWKQIHFLLEQLLHIGADLLQIGPTFVITNQSNSYHYKSNKIYYRSGQLLYIVAIITNWCTTVTQRLRWLLLIGQCFMLF